MAPESKKSVLVVDDEPQVRDVLGAFLRERGLEVDGAGSAEDAAELLDKRHFDLVFTDLNMPGAGGLGVLRHIHDHHPGVPAIVMTGYASLESAVEAMRAGALDYLTKPLSFEEIQGLVDRAFQARTEDAPTPKRNRRRTSRSARRLIGKSRAIRELNELIATVAASDSTVLIRGESGTGKELVADALHRLSVRKNRNLVPVNCGAIPEELLESELFGHVRGSFTGAIADRVGRFVMANEGTIFLDEVGDMSPKLQVKVLRVLQEQELEPVGSAQTVRVDVRVIAATNVDLERAVAERRFREDLYYRLNVIPLEVPALREHIEDLPLLIEHFLRDLNATAARPLEGFADNALETLHRYPWPGNVRELENLVERMSVLASSDIVGVDDLPEKFRNPNAAPVFMPAPAPQAPSAMPQSGGSVTPTRGGEGVSADERAFLRGGAVAAATPETAEPEPAQSVVPPAADFSEGAIDLNEILDTYEKNLILQALERTGGVKSHAAEVLGIKRTTLVEKMKKKDIVFDTE